MRQYIRYYSVYWCIISYVVMTTYGTSCTWWERWNLGDHWHLVGGLLIVPFQMKPGQPFAQTFGQASVVFHGETRAGTLGQPVTSVPTLARCCLNLLMPNTNFEQ